MADGLDLSKQIGPLPLGGWIAVIAGGLGIAYFINRDQSNSSSGPVRVAEPGVGTGGGQFIETPPSEVDTSGPELEETNANWGRKATDWLIGQGNDPGLSDNAIRKYLSSEELNSQEQSLIDQALREFGTPPEPLAPVREVQQPPEAPGKLKDVTIYRSPGVNLITPTLADPQGVNDQPTHIEIVMKGSNGYNAKRNITTIPGYGLKYRYTHFRPPNSGGVGYTYTLTPINDREGANMRGPSTTLRNVHFTRYGYKPPVSD